MSQEGSPEVAGQKSGSGGYFLTGGVVHMARQEGWSQELV